MIAVGRFHVEKGPAETRRGLKEGSLRTSPSLRENMFQLWVRAPGYQTKIPFIVT